MRYVRVVVAVVLGVTVGATPAVAASPASALAAGTGPALAAGTRSSLAAVAAVAAQALATGTGSAVAVSTGPSRAGAAGTWTVRPGGAVSLTSGKLFFTDTRTRSNIECLSARLRGRLTGGTGLPGARAGSVTAGNFTTCNNSAGPSFTLTPTGLPWRINLVSYDASAGVVTGRISHAQVTVTSPGCATVIDGTSGTARDGDVRFGYTDATARLRPRATGGDLHFYRVRGCLGLWFDGDPATLSATFAVSPRQTITSP